MSRRGKTIVKRVVLDPKYNSELVAHMIRVIMKDGKKTVAERIVYGAIDKVAEKMKEDPSKFVKDEKQFEDPLEVVSAAIDNMKPQVEVKTRRVGGTTYPVPVPIAANRAMVMTARSAGASAKFAGSGGAIVGTYTDDAQFSRLSAALATIGCQTIRPEIAVS